MNDNITNEQKFLENYKKRIIKDVIKLIHTEFKIYDNNDKSVDIETMQKHILTPKIIKRCLGTTNTIPVSQCTRNALENYDYCKIHLYKTCLQSQCVDSNPGLEIEYKYEIIQENPDNSKKRKKFIEDSFYFIDDTFIYDLNNNKVGYIEGNKYILTSDPFILNVI